MEIVSISENLFSKFLLKAISKCYVTTAQYVISIYHFRIDTEKELVQLRCQYVSTQSTIGS